MRARSLLIKIAILGGLFAAGVLIFNFFVMPTLVHQRDVVFVPDLRNTAEAQAAQAVGRLGLTLRVDRSENDPQVPAGFVVSQKPRANDTLKPGRTVSVVISLGPRSRTVPELAGMSLRQSRNVIEQAGLTLGRVARVTSTRTREAVVATAPPVGEEATEGESVDLVLEVPGPPLAYLMPDLTGQDVLFVRERLEKLGFRIGSVRYETRDGAFPNTIVEQSPRAGERVREGESIELVASGSR